MAELSTLARPYAKAAFEYADAEAALDLWQGQLATAAAVVGEPRVRELFSGPILTTTEQADQMIALCGESLSAPMANFVRALAANRRLPLLPEVSRQFLELKAAREKTVDVHVISAFDLPQDTCDRLAEVLGQKLQREVVISSETDSSLLAGLLIKAGDIVIDGSVRGRLNKLAEALTN
ncbi:MAG: F0F1 ATP synthase subunit delta [Chromatocurvus sp.]